jgi:hypothetical protein
MMDLLDLGYKRRPPSRLQVDGRSLVPKPLK